ncbi:MAG: helix-turn-helix transcriptional regulator, partial [Myxococcota bacterium]
MSKPSNIAPPPRAPVLDRGEVVERFRERLRAVIRASGLSQTAFAKEVGIDRSTLSQVLTDQTDRLPRVETLVSIARQQNVSVDWLMGLSEEGRLAAAVLQLERGAGSPSDERLALWRAEAAGY